MSEPIAYDLEHDVEGRQREDDHDEPLLARSGLEAGLRLGQVVAERAIEFGLAVAVEPDGGVELVHPLEGHDGPEEPDDGPGRDHIGVEIGAGEPEDDAGLVVCGEYGVEGDPFGEVERARITGTMSWSRTRRPTT